METKELNEDITIEDISARTSIATTDILQTLQSLGAIKPYKGQQIICLSDGVIASYHKTKEKHKNRRIDDGIELMTDHPRTKIDDEMKQKMSE